MKTIKLKCKVCGKIFNKRLSIYKQDIKKCNAGKFCSLNCYYNSSEIKSSLSKSGSGNSNWKGGIVYDCGYRMIMCGENHPNGVNKGGNKYIREHRLVMEKHLSRYLTNSEIVHHIDENITNNKIENLMLMTYSEHTKLHAKNWKRCKDKLGRFCSNNQIDKYELKI